MNLAQGYLEMLIDQRWVFAFGLSPLITNSREQQPRSDTTKAKIMNWQKFISDSRQHYKQRDERETRDYRAARRALVEHGKR